MKTNKNSTRWLGLVLAGSIITLAASAQAAKPVKPPEPPPTAAYDLVLLGDPGSSSEAIDVNESGLVVGNARFSVGYSHTTLVVPEVDNGTILWCKDVDFDGRNDLLVDLGTAAGAQGSYPCNINDHGVILGAGYPLVADAEVPLKFAWILSPQVINGQLTWTNIDNEGVNGLITPLPVLASDAPDLEVLPQRINNHGEVAMVIQWADWETLERWQRGFLFTPNLYEVSPDGAVTIEYPAAVDLDGDGMNDSLIDLGLGVRVSDGAVRPLLPTAVNDRGDVAGMVWDDWCGDVGGERPFVLRPRVDENGGLVWNEDQNGDGLNDLVIYLPLPTGVDQAAIVDMNETGTIVGSIPTWVSPTTRRSRAAMWHVDWDARKASFTDLGSLDAYKDYRDYETSVACAVNAAGQVVGRSLRYMKFPVVYQKAWLWHQGNMVPLSDLVPPETGLAEISSMALGINDSGLIVGAQQSEYPGDWTSLIAVPVAGQ